jgi:hypothetical protein
MIFGHKELFAIEATLSEVDELVLIQFCYWIKGAPIGDFEQHVLLRPVIHNFNEIMNCKGKRGADTRGLKASEIIAVLGEEGAEPTHELLRFDDELWKLNINYNQGENLDGYCTYLIEAESYDWLLCRDVLERKDYDVKIPKMNFYREVAQLLAWINSSTRLTLRHAPSQ